MKLVDSLILSISAYCDIVFWPALLQRDRNSLQKIQNACFRYPPTELLSGAFRQSAGFATDPAAQTQAKAQVYPGHSKVKEPVADQPLLQADVPSTSPGTDSEPVWKQVHVGASTLGANPVVLLGFTLSVLRRYLSP
ncbi:hypothetical protein NQ315_002523 [Exocentrus adspersus]|uniref:Uncharacterized protein n=1 Tax=Exocentrus adspersus TaxID=1586481 RepID=A0AAV8VL82_9CUCU|nr:hypothetical protein NQ315_002523 [Exocentrus adspersus]